MRRRKRSSWEIWLASFLLVAFLYFGTTLTFIHRDIFGLGVFTLAVIQVLDIWSIRRSPVHKPSTEPSWFTRTKMALWGVSLLFFVLSDYLA